MRLRRSVSNIVAVILLIVIAVTVVTVLYMWLSGVISLVYTNMSAIHVKVTITNASVVSNSSGAYVVTLVYNIREPERQCLKHSREYCLRSF